MKGTYFVGADAAEKFEVREMTFAPLNAHDVLIRNRACGVCGTDVHICRGEEGSAKVSPPVVLGHELAGEVAAVGEEVTIVRPGDRVAIDPNLYCGRCLPCRMGQKQNCENLFAIGVNRDGGFAEYTVCPDTQCYKIAETVSFSEAAMAEPLSCAIHGIDRAQIRPGQVVLVIGGGPIGLLMVQLARLSGASCVLLSEPSDIRRQIGLKVGADAVIDPIREDPLTEIRKICGRNGVDVILECVGTPKAIEQAFGVAGFHTNIVLFGVPAVNSTVSLPLFDVYKKELCVCGSIINPDTYQRAVNLINSRKLKIQKLITHCYDLYHVKDAICKQTEPDSIKVLISPDPV